MGKAHDPPRAARVASAVGHDAGRAGPGRRPRSVVRQVDHIVVESDDPAGLFPFSPGRSACPKHGIRPRGNLFARAESVGMSPGRPAGRRPDGPRGEGALRGAGVRTPRWMTRSGNSASAPSARSPIPPEAPAQWRTGDALDHRRAPFPFRRACRSSLRNEPRLPRPPHPQDPAGQPAHAPAGERWIRRTAEVVLPPPIPEAGPGVDETAGTRPGPGALDDGHGRPLHPNVRRGGGRDTGTGPRGDFAPNGRAFLAGEGLLGAADLRLAHPRPGQDPGAGHPACSLILPSFGRHTLQHEGRMPATSTDALSRNGGPQKGREDQRLPEAGRREGRIDGPVPVPFRILRQSGSSVRFLVILHVF